MPLYFQIDSGGLSGRTLYAVVRPLGLQTVWDGAAFVAYVEADWPDYAVAVAEQGSTGTYFGEWPDAFAAGWYSFTVYDQAGGSPDVGADAQVGSKAIYYTPPETPVETDPVPAGEWVVPEVGADTRSSGTKTAAPGDLNLYAFNLGNLPHVLAGAVIAAVTITASPDGLTLSDPSFGGYRAFVRITGGTDGTDYTVAAAISLSDASSVNVTGLYRVRA